MVVLIGVALLLPRLGAQSLWLDEGLTVGPAVTATSASDLVARVRAVDTQPPGSHFLLWLVVGHVPRTEFFYRLPSFVAVEIGIILLYVVVRRLWDPMVALLAALCAQLSPYLAFYAAEARNYGFWFLCITASMLAATYWYDAMRARTAARTWAWAAALATINAAGLWMHVFHVFVVFAEAVLLAAATLLERAPWRDRLHALAALVAAQVGTLALFAPWLLALVGAARAGTAGVPWTRPFVWASLGYYAFAAHFGASLGPDLRTLHLRAFRDVAAAHAGILGVAAIAMASTAIAYLRLVAGAVRTPGRRCELVPLVAWPALILAGPLAYAARSNFPLHPRHLMAVWPLLPLVLALGLVRLRGLRLVLAAVVALQVVALGNLLFNARYAKDDERGAVAFATSRSGAVAYVLGDVAPLYAAEGRPKAFRDFRDDTADVWLVDNRWWEPDNRRDRGRLRARMRAMGMRYDGGMTRFRGIVLRHWSRVP